jgi:hypothetical protein
VLVDTKPRSPGRRVQACHRAHWTFENPWRFAPARVGLLPIRPGYQGRVFNNSEEKYEQTHALTRRSYGFINLE